MTKIEARCRCGQLKFESESKPVLEIVCHCLDCQDALEADYASLAFFKMSETNIEGDFAEKIYLADSGNETCRQYCDQCDTVMFDRSEGFPHLLGVNVLQLKQPFDSQPSCHVFVRDKKTTVEIAEGMKQFEMGIT